MSQTRKRRRKKHRGTQAGTVARPARSSGGSSKPRSKEEGRELARRRRDERLAKPPSWRGATGRAALAAVLFLGLAFFFERGRGTAAAFAAAVPLALLAFLIYVPAAYYTDAWRHRRHLRSKAGSSATGK